MRWIRYFLSVISLVFYPNGVLLPWAAKGWLLKWVPNNDVGIFFKRLCASGAKATVWQEIFFGQLAGLVIRTGEKELHIRFFIDGTVFAEEEYYRWFNPSHFQYKPTDALEYLKKLFTQYGIHLTACTLPEVRKRVSIAKEVDHHISLWLIPSAILSGLVWLFWGTPLLTILSLFASPIIISTGRYLVGTLITLSE